jgi:hypothetical protein
VPRQDTPTDRLRALADRVADVVVEEIAPRSVLLRRAMIERHWRFFPLWYVDGQVAERDALLWRQEILVDAAFDLLAVLAALNRLYFTRFQLKRMRKLVGRMRLAPPDLANRLERLFESEDAAHELERLVAETQALVAAELPDLELRLRQPIGARREPWS